MVFLFFQAEDGIRDGHVTGVQTCALPIYCQNFCAVTERPTSGARSSGSSCFMCNGRGSKPIVTSATSAFSVTCRFTWRKIGRASCREREEMWVVAGSVENK